MEIGNGSALRNALGFVRHGIVRYAIATTAAAAIATDMG